MNLKYSKAPYNFVSLTSNPYYRYEDIAELPKHDEILKDHLTGYIEYEVEAKSEIIVNSGKDDGSFFKNTNGKYAVPGSTMRGITMTNMITLGLAGITKDDESKLIENSRFLYRDIAGVSSKKDDYKTAIVDDKEYGILSGIMKRENGKYYIYPTGKILGKNYHDVKEQRLRSELKDSDYMDENIFMYNSSIVNKIKEIDDDYKDRFRGLNNRDARRLGGEKARVVINKALKGNDNKKFKPYYKKIKYYEDKQNKEIKFAKSHANTEGYILTSNSIRGKLRHYIINAEICEPAIQLDKNVIDAYVDDMILTKKMDKNKSIIKGNEFYSLPNEGEEKPVFYTSKGENIQFGFMPYMRLSYNNSIIDAKNIVRKDNNKINYLDAIFGFTDNRNGNNIAYKSRVSFTDVEDIGNISFADKKSVILAGPKATSFNLYLEQDLEALPKDLTNYNREFSVRGVKHYWLKDYLDKSPDTDNENIGTNIKPAKAGSKFSGKIYFENLAEDELGLLLWSLSLNDDCYQSIGQGKPYGYGKSKVKINRFKIDNMDKQFEELFDFSEDADYKDYIEKYKEYMKTSDAKVDLDNNSSVKELMKIKSYQVKKADEEYFNYMLLEEFKEFRVLPTIEEYEKVIRQKGKKPEYRGHGSSKGKGNQNNKNFQGGKKKQSGNRKDDFDGNSPFAKLKNIKWD